MVRSEIGPDSKLTRTAPSTSERAKNQIPISSALAQDPIHQLVNLKYAFGDPFHFHRLAEAGRWAAETFRADPSGSVIPTEGKALARGDLWSRAARG